MSSSTSPEPAATPQSSPPIAQGPRLWLTVLVVVLIVLTLAWMLLRAAGGAEAAKRIETPEGVALRKAQALVINEPSDANARAWERAARVYRAQRSKP